MARRFEAVKPLMRPLRDYASYAPHRIRATLGRGVWSSASPPVFLVGCGRSGTTLLGQILSLHPSVHYLYEPRERWAAVSRATDTALAFSRSGAHCFMSASDADAPARRHFARVMKPPAGQVLVEKSPTNALRIGFLDGLAAEARFVHIVRDGEDVVRSIARKASRTRRVVGRGMVNDWWGSNDSKWRLMRDEGAAAGYYADEVAPLEGDQDRAAYEWLVSVGEVDRWRPSLADRLHEITYRDLTESPLQVVSELAGFLGIASSDRWAEEATGIVKPMRRNDGPSIVLPRGMAEDFNGLQRRYGFEGRVRAATALEARNAAVSR